MCGPCESWQSVCHSNRGTIWYSMVWYGTVGYGMVWYWYGIGMVWYGYDIVPRHMTGRD